MYKDGFVAVYEAKPQGEVEWGLASLAQPRQRDQGSRCFHPVLAESSEGDQHRAPPRP